MFRKIPDGAPTGSRYAGPLQFKIMICRFKPYRVALHCLFFSMIWIAAGLQVLAQQPKLVLPVGHTDRINTISYSPDGKFILTSSDDNTAKIWQANTGLLLADLRGHTNWVKASAYSPDGKYIATVSMDGSLKLWDAFQFNCLFTSPKSVRSVNSLKFDKTGGLLVTTTLDTVTLWDVKNRKPIWRYNNHGAAISSALFNPDNTLVMVNFERIGVEALNIRTGARIFTLAGSFAKFNPAASLIVTASQDPQYFIKVDEKTKSLLENKKPKIWNAVTGEFISDLNGSRDVVLFAEFTSDGKKILTTAMDSTLRIYDAETKEQLKVYKDTAEYMTYAGYTPNLRYLVTADVRGIVSIRDPDSFKVIYDVSGDQLCFSPGRPFFASARKNDFTIVNYNSLQRYPVVSHVTAATGISFVKNTRTFIASYDNGTTASCDITTGEMIDHFQTDHAVPGDSEILKEAGKNQYQIYDLVEKRACATINMASKITYSCFSPDGKKLFTTSHNGEAHIWSAENGLSLASFHITVSNGKTVPLKLIHASDTDFGRNRELTNVPKEEFPVTFIFENAVLNKDADRILTHSYGDRQVQLWDANDGALVRTLQADQMTSFTGASFNRDGTKIITGCMDSTVQIWSARTGDAITDFHQEHDIMVNMVNATDYSGDDKRVLVLATGAKIIDAATGKIIHKLYSPHNYLVTGRYGPGDRYIITGSDEGEVAVWDPQTGKKTYALPGHENAIKALAFSGDGKLICSASADYSVKVWNSLSKKLVCTVFAIDSTDYLLRLPNGYYRCTQNAARLLHYVTGSEPITFEQLDLKYNRPDKVLEVTDPSNKVLINAYKNAYMKRVKRAGLDTAAFGALKTIPRTVIKNRDSIETSPVMLSPDLQLQVSASDDFFKLERLQVWINDVPLYGVRGIALSAKKLNTALSVRLTAGENTIKVSVINKNGIESYRSPLTVYYKGAAAEPAATYFVGISVSKFNNTALNLRYADSDIVALDRLFAKINAGHYKHYLLYNENVTPENLRQLRDSLKNISAEDRLIVAVSGHGLVDSSLNFYLATPGVDLNNPEKKGIPYEDIEGLMDNVASRKKLLLIDACHSGEIDKDEIKGNTLANASADLDQALSAAKRNAAGHQKGAGLGLQDSFDLMKELFAEVSRNNGAVIISSARGNELANEGSKWGHGAFTYSIINGIQNKEADANGDGHISVNELKAFVSKNVLWLTGGRQKPTTRQELSNQDWEVW